MMENVAITLSMWMVVVGYKYTNHHGTKIKMITVMTVM